MSYPQLLFGGSGIGKGSFSTPDQVKTLLNYLASKNVQRIDTAALYPLENTFKSESALGESGLINRGLLADTKILLSPDFTGNGALTKSKIDDSVNGSFQRLQGKVSSALSHMYHTFFPTDLWIKQWFRLMFYTAMPQTSKPHSQRP